MPGSARQRYDVVIVGAGSAGCALANRLSADPATRVLVLEAGGRDWRADVFIHMPAAPAFPIGSRLYDRGYRSEPDPPLPGRRICHAGGRVLGGSSSINGMVLQRGNPMDDERWAADPGMSTWDHAHCLPYFTRMETCLAGEEDVRRGRSGPLVPERGPATGPLFAAFPEAVEQPGSRARRTSTGTRRRGFGPFDRNVHRGRRLSAARAHLYPVASRPNPHVRTRARSPRWSSRAAGRSASTSVGPTHRVWPRAARSSGSTPVRWCCAAARSIPPRCCRSRGSVTPITCARSGSPSWRTCPGRVSTCRTTSRCTTSTPAPGRCRCSRT